MTAAHTTPAVSTSGTAAPAKAKQKQAFFTRRADTQGTAVALYINTSLTPRAPDFGGLVNGIRVSVFVRRPEVKQPFLDIVGDKMQGTNHNTPIATANVRIVKGVPKLAMRLEGSKDTLWVSISKNVTLDMLKSLGCDVKRIGKTEAVKEKAEEAVPA